MISQRVQQGLQQRLVGEDYGGLLVERERGRNLLQKGVYIFALHDIRHARYGLQFLACGEEVVVRYLIGRFKRQNILSQEVSSLLIATLGVVGVVVPQEVAAATSVYVTQYAALALGEGVEADKDVTQTILLGCITLCNTLGGGAVDHTRIGYAERGETLAESMINRRK